MYVRLNLSKTLDEDNIWTLLLLIGSGSPMLLQAVRTVSRRWVAQQWLPPGGTGTRLHKGQPSLANAKAESRDGQTGGQHPESFWTLEIEPLGCSLCDPDSRNKQNR